jgi:hypothetical protein
MVTIRRAGRVVSLLATGAGPAWGVITSDSMNVFIACFSFLTAWEVLAASAYPLITPDVDALYAPGIDRANTHTNKGVSGIISLLGVGRVVVGPIESTLAFRVAKQAVPALAT